MKKAIADVKYVALKALYAIQSADFTPFIVQIANTRLVML